MAQRIKRLPAMQETQVGSLGWEDPLEKGMATLSSFLAWEIPWTEYEPAGLQLVGSQRVRHDLATGHVSFSYYTCFSINLCLLYLRLYITYLADVSLKMFRFTFAIQ